jgi:hypothetical protein
MVFSRVMGTISHSREEETLEAKARWFRSLSLEQRIDVFCEMTELILQNNPQAAEKEIEYPSSRSIQILSIEVRRVGEPADSRWFPLEMNCRVMTSPHELVKEFEGRPGATSSLKSGKLFEIRQETENSEKI